MVRVWPGHCNTEVPPHPPRWQPPACHLCACERWTSCRSRAQSRVCLPELFVVQPCLVALLREMPSACEAFWTRGAGPAPASLFQGSCHLLEGTSYNFSNRNKLRPQHPPLVEPQDPGGYPSPSKPGQRLWASHLGAAGKLVPWRHL